MKASPAGTQPASKGSWDKRGNSKKSCFLVVPEFTGVACCPCLRRPSIAGFGESGAWQVAEFEKCLPNECTGDASRRTRRIGAGGGDRGARRPLTRRSHSHPCKQSPQMLGKTTHHGAALGPHLTKMGSLMATHLEGWVWGGCGVSGETHRELRARAWKPGTHTQHPAPAN